MGSNEAASSIAKTQRKTRRREHSFYFALSVLYAITVFVGFSRTFFLKSFFGAKELSWIFHLHGFVFTAWTIFFVYQTGLVSVGRTQDHKRIGSMGALLAAGIAVFGALITVHAVRLGYSTRKDQMPELLVSGLMDSLMFGAFFCIGYAMRHRPEIHKRMMLLAMLCAIIPAIARLPIPPAMIGWTILVLSVTGLVYDAVINRRVYPSNLLGVLVINIWSPLHFVVAESTPWQKFTEWIAR